MNLVGVVWLTNFDHMTVPFYQAFGDNGTALAGDLLFGMGETLGCGQRHLDGAKVQEALQLHGVSEQSYKWYIDLKNTVKVQTSGFGMGIERYIAWLLDHDDIRDLQLLPRFNGEKIYF